MDQSALYEEDFHAWALHQARVLRGLAGSGLALPNSLDLEHVAEEIEDLGNEQRYAAESSLVQVFLHLIKSVALPEDPALRHWATEMVAFLATAERRWRPSMRRAIDLAGLWAQARRQAAKEFRINGLALPPLPEVPPFGLEELVSGEAEPQALVARLAAAVAGLRGGGGG
jgi:Domain of unknown function DUF29